MSGSISSDEFKRFADGVSNQLTVMAEKQDAQTAKQSQQHTEVMTHLIHSDQRHVESEFIVASLAKDQHQTQETVEEHKPIVANIEKMQSRFSKLIMALTVVFIGFIGKDAYSYLTDRNIPDSEKSAVEKREKTP